MDPTITAALIAAGGAVLGGVAGHVSGRRNRAATLALTDTQTEDLETQIAQRVVRLQEVEREKLARRIEELEAEVKDLRARFAQREQELKSELDVVRSERDALRAEVGQLHMQLVAKQAELTAAKQEIEHLQAVALAQASSPTPVAPPTV